MVFVRYEDFWADKVGVIAELADQLGLPFNELRVAARQDAQISRSRKYAPRGPGTWKTGLDEAQVRVIERLCGDEMSRWGYSPCD